MKSSVKQQAIRRLSIIEGHLKKVKKMVEKEEYCPNVIQQSSAVQSALRKVDEILLEGHLKDCVRSAIRSGGGDKEIKELLEAFSKR
ncbi:metal-sensing transcriptional repressor [Patescibacteria group bacterium]|nr:metal-sensing transcriptional repressor [Patescibacteria group bacterium]